MLSRKLVSSFLNARNVASRKDDSEKKVPSAMYPYRGAFGSLSRCTPHRPSLVDQRSILSMQTALNDEKPREQLKLSKEVEDGLRHIHLLGEIKKKREAARMKYQEILLKRSSSSVSGSTSAASSVSSGDSTISSRSSARERRRRRRSRILRRQVSEIDDRDEGQLLEAETFTMASNSTPRSKVIPRVYESSLSLDTIETNITDELETSKKRPYIKKYAQEYNTLVTAVSKFFTKNKSSGPERDTKDQGSVIKYGTLRKISHIDVGIGTDVFCELRPGMITFYNKVDEDNIYVDVRSMPIRRGQCTCRPTRGLAKAPYPMWDAVFEMSIDNRPPQFLMAESANDRQDWISAFAIAMNLQQGDNVDMAEYRQDGNTTRSTYEEKDNSSGYNADILLYLHVRGLVQGASSRQEYMDSISILRGKTISIPIHWLKEYFEDSPSFIVGNEDILEELTMLREEVFSINGHIVRGDLDSVVGSFKSHIIDLDNCSCTQNQIDQPKIKESQAIFFARDMLLSSDREKSDNHAKYCASKMLGNDVLVSITRGFDGMEAIKIQLRKIHGRSRSKELHESKKECAQDKRENNYQETVEVTLSALSIYRICSCDPLNNEEAWALLRTNYIQKFVLGPNEMTRMDQFVQFDTVPCQY